MIQASPETIAIARATRPNVEARQAEIMLRMWHHLQPHAERDTVFADFDGDGVPRTMLRALIAQLALDEEGISLPFKAPPGIHADHAPMLAWAFRLALNDCLGDLASESVTNAWSDLLTAFMTNMLRPDTRR